MATIRVIRSAVLATERPEAAWQCDIFTNDGTDYHGTGSTAEEAAARATAYWIEQERAKR